MKKFCCIPCNDIPNIDVEVQCVSACCASRLSDNRESKRSNEGSDEGSDVEETQICCTKCLRKGKKKAAEAKRRTRNTQL